MKRNAFLTVLLCGIVCFGFKPAQAQESDPKARKIVQRYEEVTGIDKLDPKAFESVSMDIKADVSGVALEMKILMNAPDKYRIAMKMGSEEMLAVIKGDQGWMQIEGMVMPLPADMLESLRKQTDLSRNYKWSDDTYAFQMDEEKQINGKTFQGVKIIPKEKIEGLDYLIAYFDQSTGYVNHMITPVKEGGKETLVRIDMADYKKYSGMQVPSEFKIFMSETLVGTMNILDMKLGIKIADDQFELAQ